MGQAADALFSTLPKEGEAPKLTAAQSLFAGLPMEGQEPPDTFSGAVSNLGSRIAARSGQIGSQLMMEHTAQRAADRQKTFGQILEEAQTSAGLKDMQGKPIKTWTGTEYASAAARWIDAKYADLIGTDDAKAADEYAAAVQKNMEAQAAAPKSRIAEDFQKKAMVKDATLGQTLGNVGGAILDNPLGGLSWALETAGESAPQIGAGMAATLLTRNPATGIAIAGGGSYATERFTSPGEFFAEKGLDLKKPEDRQKLLNDPKLMKEAADRGVIRGIIVGAFDAMSGGLAGKTLLKNPVAESVAQTLTQAILGGGGELTARIAAGQEIDWGEVIGEGLAEVATLPFDMITAGRGQEPPPAPGPGAPGAPGAVAGEEVIGGAPTPPPGTPAAPAPELPVAPDLDRPTPPPTPVHAAAAVALPQQIAEAAKLPDSEHLTPLDRKSPIPNELIEEGKATIAAATGQPSTFTTTQEINGKRTVVTGNVADLNAGNRAETSAVIEQIMAGVAPSPALAQALQAASPVSEEPVAGTPGPSAAPAAVAPLKIEGRDPVLPGPAEAPAPRSLTIEGREPVAPGPAEAAAPRSLSLEGRDQVAGEDFSNAAHPRSEDTKDFGEWVKKVHAFSDARKAKAKEMVAAAGGVGIPMRNKEKPNKRALVGPDMTEADRGKFRVTFIDQHGPSGHMVYNTFEEATEEALRDGYVVDQAKVKTPLAAKVEAVRVAKAETPALPPRPQTRPIKDDVAITPAGREVPVTYAVIEADDLIASQRDEGGANPAYPQELQPRDRSRGTSDVQINKIAANLDPRLLDQNPNASDGAPIISEDGVVESGNGRVLGIRKAFRDGLDTAKGYVDYLRSQGYPVDGMKRPVLVRVRKGELQGADRQAFTVEANERSTLALTATERAMADSGGMKPATVELYRGGDITDAGNREFVRSFMKSINPNDQAAMVTPDGTLSQEGIRRVQGALLARAYGDPDLVGALVESTDSNIKAIGGALMDVSPQWAQMTSEAKDGTIDPGVDVTAGVLEAVRLVQRARSEGRPLAEFVNQMDAFSGTAISPTAEAILRLMFRNTASWTQPAGREKLAEALRYYATEARKTSAGTDLLGESAPPATAILEQAKKRQYGQEQIQGTLTGSSQPARPDNRAAGEERAVEAKPRAEPAGSASAAPKARPAKAASKLAKKAAAKRAETAAARERFPAGWNWKGSVGDFSFGYLAKAGEPNVWQVRRKSTGEVVNTGVLEHLNAASNAARRLYKESTAPAAAKGQPKFSKELDELEAEEFVFTEEDEAENAALKERLTSPEIKRAEAEANAIQDTSTMEGYDTDDWWLNRVYNFGKEKVKGKAAAVKRLIVGAERLAIKEINESRVEANEQRAKDGLPPLRTVEDYEVERGYRATLVVGPPGAGKSTIANPIARRLKAAISDVDEAKKVIPGYNGGIGAQAVHTESWALGIDVSTALMSDGRNLVIPTVGESYKKIENLRRLLVKNGYTVDLVLMDVTPRTAVKRMLGRFERTGRLIPPDYFLSVVWKPPHIFRHAQKLGLFDGYARVTSTDTGNARVAEASGGASRLAVGEEFERTGTIRPGGRTSRAGGDQRVSQGQAPRSKREADTPVRIPASELAQVESRQSGNADITYITTPAFREKAAAVVADLRKRLDGYGLTNVDLSVWEQMIVEQDGETFTPEGQFIGEDWVPVIDLALRTSGGETNLTNTLDHETGHALFKLALGDREKSMILHKAKQSWITDAIRKGYSRDTGRTLAEEAAVRAWVRWMQGERMDGVVAKAFKKMKTFLKALYQALTGHDIRTVDDIFRQMQSGKIGRRTQRGGRTGSPLKVEPAYAKTETVDMFEGKREQFVLPGAEKISDASLAQRRADAPLQAKRNQKDLGDLPLFSDEKKQMSLFSKPPTLKLGGEQKADLKARVEAAIDEVYKTLFPNPLAGNQVGFANKAQDKVVMMELENYGDSLYVKWLSAFPQKGGMGTEGINFLKKIAKKHNVPLSLTPWRTGELGEKKLTKIFNKWGFVAGKQGLLWWHPAPYETKPSGPNDPRFQLMQPPPTSQAAQQVMQGWLSRGQFLDRAMRFPLDLIGGLDRVNNWKPGKRLNDKIGSAGRQGAGIGAIIGASAGGFVGGLPGAWVGAGAGATVGGWLLGSKAAPSGVFRWMAVPAEIAKRGLIDRYGLTDEYVKTQQKSELGKSAILRQAQGILQVLASEGVGTTEAKVLQDVLTGKPVQDADMIRLAVPIRQAIDALGAEAVSLGLISAESFQRNRGAYLHRVYTKNEIDTGKTMAGWVSKAMTKRRQAIIGDQLKGRGMFLEKPPARIMQDVDSFKAGKRGAPVLGEKFHIIDEVSTPAASMTPGAQPTEKVLRRVYLPANEAIPAKYSGPNWKNKGTWEVRRQGKNTTLWRDFTEAERTQMGELIDARYNIAKTFMLMANDLSTGRFFQDVAVNAEWTSSTPPKTKWKEASDYGRFWEDPEIEWVRVPDTSIADTGGKKRWGALSGKFVRAEIWRDINEVNIANNPGTWRKLLSQWKLNKTARNPVVHMNNIMSNVMWMDLADVRSQDLIAGIRAYATSSPEFIEARDNGAFGTDMIAQEIRDNVLMPILEEIKKQQGTGTGATAVGFLGKAKLLGIIADKVWGGAKWVDNKMIRAYQAEDELFRMALYLRRRRQGESAEVAAQHARDQFLNYDIRAPWVIAMRQTLLPFVSYTYRAVPKLMESILNRPWKLAKYMAVAAAVNSLSYMMDDGDDGEERERAALRDEEQGYTWLGTPRMVRMPWRDGHGLPVFLDARRWVPAGDIFDDTQGHSAIPIPAPLQFGGPLALAFELKQNRSAFTGEDITNSLTDTNWDKTKKVADWAWKSWAPAGFWVPRSWYWTKIANAVYGATDAQGRPYSVPQAVASSVGIKVKPVDVDDGIKWHYVDFEKVATGLKSDLRSNSMRYERGLISKSAFESENANIMSKLENLSLSAKEFQQQVKRPKREPAE